MRSRTIITSSMAGAVAAGGVAPAAPVVVPAVPAAGAGTYVDCIATCKPILDVSAMCGLPVPADPAMALNPAGFGAGGRYGWKRDAAAPAVGPWGPWGGAGGAAGAAGAWGGYGGGYGGAYGGGLFNQAAINCVCSTKAIDFAPVEIGCLTCLAKVTTVSNPWLNTLGAQCGLDVAGLAASSGYSLAVPGGAGGYYSVGANGVPLIPVGGAVGGGVGGGYAGGLVAGPNGLFYNAQGQLCNGQGQLVDINGKLLPGAGVGGGVAAGLVAGPNGQLYNAKGQPVDANGLVIGAGGAVAGSGVGGGSGVGLAAGVFAGPNGLFYNAKGQQVNAQGQLINAQNQLIDANGAVIPAAAPAPPPAPVPAPAPAPAPKPASKNVLHDEDDDEEHHGADEITKRHDGKGAEHKDSNPSPTQKGSQPKSSGAEKMMSARGLAGVVLGSAAIIAISLF